jgi:hypothetical protein
VEQRFNSLTARQQMKTRFQNFCSFIDDVPTEALAIIEQLRHRGSLDLQPVFPAQTTTVATLKSRMPVRRQQSSISG